MSILLLKWDSTVRIESLSNVQAPLTKVNNNSSHIILLLNQELLKLTILLFVARSELEKCCITFAYLQCLFHSGERALMHGPLVLLSFTSVN